MTFSIIIVVRNDRAIHDTLQHLEPLVATRKNFETIVVDASQPTTLKDIKTAFPWVRWFYYKNTTGKRFTIPEQRNLGVKKATGDVVVFVDASCITDKNWPDVLEQAFQKEGHDAVAGMVTSSGSNKSTYDEGYNARVDNGPLEECGAANLAIRKKIIQEIGGFDDNMSYGEDVDLTWRVRDAGYQIIFKKGLIISHDWGTFKDEMRRSFRYGQARTGLYKKHPGRWRGLLGIDIMMLIYPLYILLLPLTIWFPFYPLVIIVPLLKNSGKKPFKTTFLHIIYGTGVIKGVFVRV